VAQDPDTRPDAVTLSETPPAATPLDKGHREAVILGGIGSMVPHFHLKDPHRFATAMVEWGQVATKRKGPGVLAGRLEVLIQILPLFVMSQSQRAYGVGFMPIFLRWDFDQRGRVQPFLELAGGLLLTNTAVPEGTARFNYLAHAGPGLRIWLNSREALLAGYSFHHLSNGNRLPSNPGINSNFFYAGISLAH